MVDQKTTPSRLSGETESLPGAKIEGHSARIERYSKAKNQAENHRLYIEENIGNYAGKDQAALRRLNESLCSCGNYLLFHNYYTIGETRLVKAHFCKKHLACPLCAIRRGAKYLRTYLERFEYLKGQNSALKASLVTLTVKNGPDLLERFEHLKAGVKKANQRMRDARRGKTFSGEFRKILGYVGSYEVKKGQNSGEWHPHVHMIVLHEEDFCFESLSHEWLNITGDSFIVDIQPFFSDPVKGFCEVFKYALKFSSMTGADLMEAYLKLSGKNLVFSGGLFRGLKVPKELTDDVIEDLPYIEMMYRYGAAGYSLTEYKKVPAAGEGADGDPGGSDAEGSRTRGNDGRREEDHRCNAPFRFRYCGDQPSDEKGGPDPRCRLPA